MRFTLALLCLLSARTLFAVDGVVLISQSTVTASGGFPLHIKQAGSYRLSSNLIAPLNESAIEFDTANVSLDLNGFEVSCSFNENSYYGGSCINDGRRRLSRIRIGNGFINSSGTSPTYNFAIATGIDLSYSKATTIEDIHFGGSAVNFSGTGLSSAPQSIVRHNIFSDAASPNTSCPSLVEGNVNETSGAGSNGSGCTYINNVGLF